MKGLNRTLWPIRYKPYQDELLSCWLMRLAHGHGLKVQTFCNLLFGNQRQVWNRDVDRLAPAWLLDELIQRTGTPRKIAHATTLRRYEGWLYGQFKSSGALQWMLTLKMYHRKREGFGLQFCPMCLAEDEAPYFRTHWRVAFNTFCHQHGCLLHDRCPHCGSAVVFHRRDIGQGETPLGNTLAHCHQCGFDLRRAPVQVAAYYDQDIETLHKRVAGQLLRGKQLRSKTAWSIDRFDVLRKLVMLQTASYRDLNVHEYTCAMLDIDTPQTSGHRLPFESRPLQERRHLLQLGLWFIQDLEPRLRSAWSAKALHYNHMKKDFEHAPQWYLDVVERFSDWRGRKTLDLIKSI